MQKPSLHLLLPALIAFFFSLVLPLAHAAETAGDEAQTAKVEQILQTMLKAILADDYAAFLAPGTKDFSQQISEYRFALIRQDIAPALKNGYTVTYDIEVLDKGLKSFHWKITPRKGDTELRAILTLKGDRVHDLSVQ